MPGTTGGVTSPWTVARGDTGGSESPGRVGENQLRLQHFAARRPAAEQEKVVDTIGAQLGFDTRSTGWITPTLNALLPGKENAASNLYARQGLESSAECLAR